MKILYRISFLSLLFLLLPYFNGQSQQANSAAYNILLPNQNGTILSLDKNIGKYVYLHFWASWCEQSLTQFPILNDIYAHYHQEAFGQADGFEIYSVSLDSDRNEWLGKLSQNQLIWPQQVCDFSGYASPVCRQYQITSTPSSFLISPNGTIVAQNISPKQLENFLAEQSSKVRYGSSSTSLIQTFSQNANNPVYKIQLGVFKYPNLQKFAHIQHLGKLETEMMPEGYTRITLGSFSSEAETKSVLAQVRTQVNCEQAFVLAVPKDILPATNGKQDDFWANAQNYNAGIVPAVSTTTKESTFYDQDLMAKPVVETTPETIVPDFGISDQTFVKADNREVKLTVYAPKEQPPAIRIVETVRNEPLQNSEIANNTTYSPNQTFSNQTYTPQKQAPAFVAKNEDVKTSIANITTTTPPTPSKNFDSAAATSDVNIDYGISESYTKPSEIGTVMTKTWNQPKAVLPPTETIANTTTTTKAPTLAEKPKADIPVYDYNAALERTKQKELSEKTTETGKNWVAPDYYPSEHNKEWRDYSVVNKASDTKTDADWDPKKQSAVPAPPKVETQTIVESEEPKGEIEKYNYENKKKDSKAVKAIPSSENFKWEPKKSHTYPTTYPRKETELPLLDNIDIPKYDYPKEQLEDKKKKGKKNTTEVLENKDKMTRKEKRKKKREEKKKK